MNTEKFTRIRQLILDSTTLYDLGIIYDTDSAPEKGYLWDEIAAADYLFSNCSFYTTDLIDKIRFINGDPDRKYRVYFVEFVKIVFVIDPETGNSSHIFEEELEKLVVFKRIVAFCDQHLDDFLPSTIADIEPANQPYFDRLFWLNLWFGRNS